ncbi:MAG: hypothetical protein H7Y11_14745, partial [Armatimonadetes bacterium]|nr:hypothetical protein [Anaerolineae bacterium]
RLAETARQGYIQVFYNLNGVGREELYHVLLTAVTTFTGGGLLGYHILAAWLGMLTCALLYALGRRLYGNFAGLTAMGVFAFSFTPMLLARTVGRETLLPLLTVAILLALALGLPVYWRRRSNQTMTTAFAALGILIGASVYVHPAGLLLAVCGVGFTLYMLLMRRYITRQLVSFIGFGVLVLLITTTPYLVSTLRLPELSGVTRLMQGFTSDTPLLERLSAGILAVGVRGDLSPVSNVPGRPLVDPVSALMMLIGAGAAVRYAAKPRYALVLFACITLLPLLLLHEASPLFSRYAPLLPVLALLAGLGARVMVKFAVRMTGREALVGRVAAVGLSALLLFTLGWTTLDANRWAALPATQAAYNTRLQQIAQRIDLTADDLPTIVCIAPLSASDTRTDLTAGQLMGLMLHRTDADLRYVDCNQGMLFINGGGLQQVLLTEPDSAQLASPFILEWLQKAQPVTGTGVPSDSVLVLEVASALADVVGRFTTTAPVSYPPEAAQTDLPLLPPVRFGGNLTFLGYQIPDVASYPPGGVVTVTTFWRVDGALPSDLQFFTHILSDPSVQPIAQSDIISVNPAELRARDVLIQVTYVPLPVLTPADRYTVSIGAYQGGDKQRMAVLGADGATAADRLFLYTIDVE